MKKSSALWVLMLTLMASWAQAQLERPQPVFQVELLSDREPAVAGEELRLAVIVTIDQGWHINSDEPGDEFALPTTVDWTLPDGWPDPTMEFPEGEELRFSFSETPLEVWHGTVALAGSLAVPADAIGTAEIRARVTAQACNDTQCLPPVPVTVTKNLDVAAVGTETESVQRDTVTGQNAVESDAALGTEAQQLNRAVFSGRAAEEPVAAAGDQSRLAELSFPLLILTVFAAGLALNLTPCVYPLIPITVGFFAQQAKQRTGGTLGLAVAYVLGMSVTYSVLGVTAALTGRLFGSALQSPVVVGVIVAIILALAASMFGLWELRVPGWAMRASGGRSGSFGALLMGLVVGFVAAPCIGPFVLGLLTFVGQRGDPVYGFILFFTLAMGLGLPYLVLGTFTGSVSKLPASGEWMIGVRKVFGVLLVALAVYFARSLIPGDAGSIVMSVALIAGGLYLLVVDRTGHQQAAVDRFMRLVSVILVVAGILLLPREVAKAEDPLEWLPYDAASVAAAVESGRPVILDFYADWCAPCRELDEKTFSDPRVAGVLSEFARFKVDQTRSNEEGDRAAMEFKVMGMPTVIVFRDGRELFRITGFEPPERFLERL
jgi:thiol:disulfide interchange protein DsbD